MPKLREQLIRIQKKNYLKSVRLVRENLGQEPGIAGYEKEYLRHLKNYEDVSDKADLIKKVLAADLVYHGDYHTLKQSQSSVLRILREIWNKREIVLCLEMFHGGDQRMIDKFMSGEISEDFFLKKIDYARKWPFRWNHWLPIISFCRDHGIRILGMNTRIENGKGIKSLKARDQYSARIITKALIRNPGKLIYVVDGDYHISPDHLPKNVDLLLKSLDEAAKSFIIFQNAENLYWKLCAQGLEESDVLRISANMYCVMNTMPANKIQSYLNWLEYSEDAYFPVHQDWEDAAFEERGGMIREMVSTFALVFDLKIPPDALEKLTIHYPSNLRFMELIHRIPELKGHFRLIRDKIKRGEGFLLEYEHSGDATYLIYLANSNINMAAEEACHFFNAVLRGPLKKSLSHFDHFYRSVIIECLGFLGSKFINEKRKSQSENALRKFLGKVNRGEYKKTDQETVQVARYLLQHFYIERKSRDSEDYIKKFSVQYKSRSAVSRMFSTQLGYMLGNKLYYAVKRGNFSVERIRELFCDPFEAPERAFKSYLEISDRVKAVKPVRRL